MLRIGTVVMGVGEMRRAREFWQRALGYLPRDGQPGPEDDFIVLVPPDGHGTPLALGTSESPVQERGGAGPWGRCRRGQGRVGGPACCAGVVPRLGPRGRAAGREDGAAIGRH
jgi:hypothetical protein